MTLTEYARRRFYTIYTRSGELVEREVGVVRAIYWLRLAGDTDAELTLNTMSRQATVGNTVLVAKPGS